MATSEDRFSHKITGNGRVLIPWRGRSVVTLAGNQAVTFIQRAEGLSGQELQLLLARVTGNFKRGNERSADKR